MANIERFITTETVINRAAIECGLNPVTDAFSSNDPAHGQLIQLLNSCGQELLYEEAWQYMVREESFTTTGTPNEYDLPTDFAYMIPQTGWQRTQNVPLYGPLSPQDWQYLQGRNLLDSTIYASFRISENQLKIYPAAVSSGQEIAYEYMSRNWVDKKGAGLTYRDTVEANDDAILYQPILIVKALKRAFLAARGFDTTRADHEYARALEAYSGSDKSAPILNAGKHNNWFPYLDQYRNTPDKGFGS